MFIRIEAKELREISGIDNQNIYQFFVDLDRFYGKYLNDENYDLSQALIDDHYYCEISNKIGDKRTRGGRLGKKDYHLIRKELGCL